MKESASDLEVNLAKVELKMQEKLHELTKNFRVRHLELVWLPDARRRFSGEVRNGILYIYEEDEEKAMETLKHELIDHVLTSNLITPLVGLVNLLIKSKEAEIYSEKEKIVDVLSKLVL